MRETFLGRKAKLDYQQAAGRLLPADAIESRWGRIITETRNRLLAVPARVGARISSLDKVHIEVIDREIRNALQELGE